MRLRTLAAHPAVVRSRLVAPEHEVTALHGDSRRVSAGTAFFALEGRQTDGHRFLDAAVAAGADVLIVSRAADYERLAAQPPPGLAGVLQAAPGRAALADLSAAVQGHPSRQLRLLGVTGTSGKSTVVHLIGQLLAALEQPYALLGTQGMRMGGEHRASARTTPEAPDIQAFLRGCVGQGVATAAMEVTSIGIALERVRGLEFAASAFTNLSQDHLDFHGDMQVYRDAKFRLFLEGDPPLSVVNVDDPTGGELVAALRQAGRGDRILTVGFGRRVGLTLTHLHVAPAATSGRIRHGGQVYPFRFALPGRFNLSNLMTALGLLVATGTPLEPLAAAVARCSGAAGRFERVALDAPFTVLVDYAHKPAALQHVLEAARPLGSGALRVLFGCGGDRDRGKRPQMGAIAEALADDVVLTSDNPRSEPPEAILAEIAAGMTGRVPARRIVERREAIHDLLARAQPGDVVLIAGKGDEPYQEAAGERLPFDDRDVVREWSRLRGRATGTEG